MLYLVYLAWFPRFIFQTNIVWQQDENISPDYLIPILTHIAGISCDSGKLIPIEVKSADNTKAKSLKVYMEKFKPDYVIKVSAKNFGFEDNKKTVPLYAVFCIPEIG